MIASRFLSALSLVLIGMPALAEPPADKSSYHLFNPTPRAQMRELAADRPDVTESAYTVDAGHFQAELSFFEYSHLDHGSTSEQGLSVLPANLKIGLTNQIDLQLVIEPYVVQWSLDSGGRDRADGFGDLTVRLKTNLVGNDGGEWALALMPWIKVPTASDELGNRHVEGGLIVPLSFALPADFSLSMMAEFDAVRDEDNHGYGLDFVHTVSVGRPLIGSLDGFVEYVGAVPHDTGSGYRATLGGGLVLGLTDNLLLDFAARFGLSSGAEDVILLAGMTIRY